MGWYDEVRETDEPDLHYEDGRPTHYAGGKPKSCPKCAGMHSDYRSEYGHLTYDAANGGTVLEPHEETK